MSAARRNMVGIRKSGSEDLTSSPTKSLASRRDGVVKRYRISLMLGGARGSRDNAAIARVRGSVKRGGQSIAVEMKERIATVV
jgi:hypothetical protein